MRILVLTLIILFVSSGAMAQGPGMMWRWTQDRCPLCGQEWDGEHPYYRAVPDSLDRPKNEKWIDKLEEVLALEELSKKQYEADQDKFKLQMPYIMVIPQEENHIHWIRDLFMAYGITPEVESLPVEKTETLREAYENAMKLEEDLIPKYEQLIINAEDKVSREVLGNILLQTRMHYVMFSHALEMGEMGRMSPMRFRMRW